MAQIDLSRFSPDLPQQTRQRQEFAGEGEANAYKALASLGNTMASVATDLHNKEMDIYTDRESANAESKLQIDVTQEKVRAAQNRNQDNQVLTAQGTSTGLTYEEYISQYIDEKRTAAYDALSEPISKIKFDNKITPWATQTKAQSAIDNANLTAKLSDEQADVFINQESRTITNSTPIELSDNLDQALANFRANQGELLRKSMGDIGLQTKLLKATNQFVRSAFETNLVDMQADPSYANTSSINFAEFTGLGIHLVDIGTAEKYFKAQYFDIMGEEADDDYIKTLTAEMVEAGSTNMKIEQNPHYAATQSPEKQADDIRRGLSIMFNKKKEKDHSSTEYKTVRDNIMAIPLDMGGSEKTWQGMDRIMLAPKKLMELWQNPELNSAQTPVKVVQDMLEANANFIKFKQQMTPSRSLMKGKDLAGDFWKQNVASISALVADDPTLTKALNKYADVLGTDYRAKFKNATEGEARQIKNVISNDPEKAMILYGSERLTQLANGAFPNGKPINEKNLSALDRTFRGEFAGALSPWSRDVGQNLIGEIASKYFTSTRALLESNDPANQALAYEPLKKLSPEFGGKLLTVMESKGYIKPNDAASLRAGWLLDGGENTQLYKDIISSGSKLTVTGLNNTFMDKADNQEIFKNVTERVTEKVNKFYEFSTDMQGKQSVIAHVRNYVLKAKSDDMSLNEDEFTDNTIKQLLNDNKMNLNTKSIKGTFKKIKPDEDTSAVENSMETKLNIFKGNLIKGTVDVDMNKVPGFERKFGKYDVTKNGQQPSKKNPIANGKIIRDFFANDAYDISYESANDAGKDRSAYIVVRDKSTNQKAFLRDSKGNVIKVSVD